MGRSLVHAVIAVSFATTFVANLELASADVIDFEHIASDDTVVPGDDAVLSNPYQIKIGGVPTGGTVRFFFDTNNNNTYQMAADIEPVFENRGPAGDAISRAFISQWTNPDTVDSPRTTELEQRMGNFFLRKGLPQGQGDLPGPFMAVYNTTLAITELSGEIWDIDSNDQWLVEVLSSTNAVLKSRLSPKFAAGDFGPDTLDSAPWLFQFTELPADVRSLRITYKGTNNNGVGFAFDNFSPTFAEQLTGDYNRNGLVDAADYAVWRNTVGSTTNLAADGDHNGSVDPEDYTLWRANFGRPAGVTASTAAASASAVPEPSMVLMAIVAFAAVGIRRRPTSGRGSRGPGRYFRDRRSRA